MSISNRHLKPGEIRAYQDQYLEESELSRVKAHLAACSDCRMLADELQKRARRLQAHFEDLDDPSTSHLAISPQAAHYQFKFRMERNKEKQPMKTKIISRIPRAAWITLVVSAVLAASLVFEPVRTLAGEFLALFRVEQIRVVRIDPNELSEKLDNSSQLEYILSNEVEVEKMGEPIQVDDPDEASSLAGFKIRLPAEIEGEGQFIVQPGARLSIKLNLELVRGVLRDLEREDIQLPDGLDGAEIGIEIPSSVAAYSGTCRLENYVEPTDPDAPQPVAGDRKDCISLIQVPSPLISAPPDLDLNKIGEAYLQVLGMDPQEAASFADSVNWTTTFVVPIPRYPVEYEEVQIAGTTGTLIYDNFEHTQTYILLWIRDGVIFALGGFGDRTEALQIADSIP